MSKLAAATILETHGDKLKSAGIFWDEESGIFTTELHNELRLKFSEIKNDPEKHLEDFIKLTGVLKKHLEFGVSKTWADSELNRYVYLRFKNFNISGDEYLSTKFSQPVLDAWSRFYKMSSLMELYKNHGAKAPITIDLIGTTGAGKTSFCQQFVCEESQKILAATITQTGKSTVVRTDILITHSKEKKIVLRAREKKAIMREIILAALCFAPEADCRDISSGINFSRKEIDKDTAKSVSDLFAAPESFEKFRDLSEKIKADKELDKSMADGKYDYILDEIVRHEFGNINEIEFYESRNIYNLDTDGENTVIKYISPSNVLGKHKDKVSQSYRILFDHALLILPCSDDARKHLGDFAFEQGIVFRDPKGHDDDDQFEVATDFECDNKLFLIPIDSGGNLINDRYSNLFDKILISDPKKFIFVLTKANILPFYKESKNSDYGGFEEFKKLLLEQYENTHDNLIKEFNKRQEARNIQHVGGGLKINSRNSFARFMEAFDNAYISEIKPENFQSEAYRVVYVGDNTEPFDISKGSVEYCDSSCFEIVSGIVKESKVDVIANRETAEIDKKKLSQIVDDCVALIMEAVNKYTSSVDWKQELNKQMKMVEYYYGSIFSAARHWGMRAFFGDAFTSAHSGFFKDFALDMFRYIYDCVTHDGNPYIETTVVQPLNSFLSDIPHANPSALVRKALEKSILISYKLYDRDLARYSARVNFESAGAPVDILDKLRDYETVTEHFAGIYLNLLKNFKSKMERNLCPFLKIVLYEDIIKLTR